MNSIMGLIFNKKWLKSKVGKSINCILVHCLKSITAAKKKKNLNGEMQTAQ